MKYVDVMVDLETLSLKASAVILQIGACTFNHLGEERKTFSLYVDRKHQDYSHRSFDTLAWWDKQNQELRDRVFSGTTLIRDALDQLRNWLYSLQAEDPINTEIRIWCKGANFDEPILTYAFNTYAIAVPWKYQNVRCVRTLIALGSECTRTQLRELFYAEHEREFISHDALDDALMQSIQCEYAIECINTDGLAEL